MNAREMDALAQRWEREDEARKRGRRPERSETEGGAVCTPFVIDEMEQL